MQQQPPSQHCLYTRDGKEIVIRDNTFVMQQQPPSQHDHPRRYHDNKNHNIDKWPQLQQRLHQEQQQQQVPVQSRHVGYMRMLSDPSSIAPLMTSSQVIVGRTRAEGGGGRRHDRFLVPDKSVSLQHALVEITGDGSVTIADLGSRNGSAQVTALHNRVLGQGVSYIVEHRDVFYFGCCAVHFLLGAAPSSPSSRPAKRVVRKRERWNAAGMCAPRLAEAAASSFLRLSLGM